LLPELSEKDNSKWIIPISFATKERVPNIEVPEYWLTDKDQEIVIENALMENDYFYLNINRTGYYRVNYDNFSWKQLIFNMENLPQRARAQLVDDAFNLARANIIEYDVPLTIGLVLLKVPKDYLSWWAFSNGIEYISNMINREAAFESFRAIMKNLIKNPYDNLGFDEIENESLAELLHRTKIIRLACDYGIDRCTNRAQILYRDWMSDRFENK
jgi:aminopeptidase N